MQIIFCIFFPGHELLGGKTHFAHNIMIFDNLAILAHLGPSWQVGSREMVTMGLFDDLGAH